MSLNSLQDNMDRRATEMAQMAQRAKNPQEIQAIQQHLITGVQNGSIKSYIGIPLIQELTQKLSAAKASMAMGAMGGQPQGGGAPIAQQVMQQAQQESAGIESLPSGLPQEYAGGGIIAFADGGMSDQENDEEGIDFNTKDDDAEDAQIMAMFAPKRRTAGLESLMTSSPTVSYESSPNREAVKAEKSSPSGNKYEALTVEKGESGGVDERLLKHILHKESRGQRYDKQGNLLTSSKGAMGEMQVMPGTSRDPGFGITPARGNDPDELRRVGDEYARAMLSRYQDPKLAAIAYNWGPGNTDKWLSAGADMSKLPKETRGYIQGLAGGGAVRFQNRGLVDLGDEDYTTIEGLESSDLYRKNLRKAQGIADLAAPRKPGQMLPGFNERMSVPEDFNTIQGMQPSTLYADKMREARGLPTPPTNKLTFGETLRGMFTPEASEGAPTTRSVDTPTTPRGPSQTVMPQGYKVNGPSADANTMRNIDLVGRQLDEARADFRKMQPPGQRQLQADPSLGEKYNAARDRMNALQQGYENMMADTGMNQAAFGVFRGATGTTKPQANPMVQAMGAQQPVGATQYPGASQINTSGSAQTTQSAPSSVAEQDRRAVFRGQLNKSEQDAQALTAAREAQAAAAAANQGQGQPAPAAAQPDGVSELADILKQQRAGIGKQREIDNYLALLSAGLGAAGGKSRNALENINAGAQQGIGYMLQAGRTRSADERNLLSGHLGLEKAKMYSAAQQAGRDDRDRARLMDNLAGYEKGARGQAISLIGQDKLGAMDPAAQQAAVDRMVAKILSESKPYQSQMKRLMGEDYSLPQTPVAGNNVRRFDSKFGI